MRATDPALLWQRGVQPVQVGTFDPTAANLWQQAIDGGVAFSGWRADRIIACGGLIRIGHGRAQGWFLAGADIGPIGLLVATRIIRDRLTHYQSLRNEHGGPPPYRRIEIQVEPSFMQGHAWARRLGFRREALLRCYDQFGRDQVQYVRIHRNRTHGRRPHRSCCH